MRGRVADGPGGHVLDNEGLASLLRALAYPLRLELLGKLRKPHVLGELRLSPHRVDEGDQSRRPAARQTVQYHLDKLVAAGLAKKEDVERRGRSVPAYRADPLQLYAVVEEIMSLIMDTGGPDSDTAQTISSRKGLAHEPDDGPRLILVRGIYEGRAYPLRKETMRDGGWGIGRAAGMPICLDYDPFASRQAARIDRAENGFTVTDLGSTNGTFLNWRQLPEQQPHGLTQGDVVRVGRSSLLYRR